MLINDAILQRGRYRVIRLIASIGDDYLYVAQDNVLFNEVIIRETRVDVKKVSTLAEDDALNSQFAETAKSLSKVDHPSILSIRSHFFEANEHYLVTEPVEGTGVLETETPLDRSVEEGMVRGADEMLAALEYLREFAPNLGALAIRPEYLWLTPDLRFKFMFFGPIAESHDKIDFSYQPLESVWNDLDRASQNVISHSYDDRALEILEQPADIRSDVYSLGAAFYHLSTGRKPIDALERSIEILDEKTDPLNSPSTLNPSMSETFAGFLTRSLELRRENRFSSAGEARGFLAPILVAAELPQVSVIAIREESDLLEIPAVVEVAPVVAAQAFSYAGNDTTNHSTRNNFVDPKVTEGDNSSFSDTRTLDLRHTDHESKDDDLLADILLEVEPDLPVNDPDDEYVSAGGPAFGKRFFRPIPIAVGAVLVLGASVWGILTMTGSGTRGSDGRLNMSVGTINPASDPPANTPAVSVTPEPTAVQEPESANSGETLPAGSVPRTRQQIADAKALRRPETPATEKSPPKTKKRVTVDDLINDN